MKMTKTTLTTCCVLAGAVMLPGHLQAEQLAITGEGTVNPALYDYPDSSRPRFGLGVHGGTMGIGPHLNYDFNEWFSIRGAFNYMEWDEDVTYSKIRYDGDLTAYTYSLTGSIKPFAKASAFRNFRITAGGVYVDADLELKASSPGTKIKIGDAFSYTLTSDDALTGSVDFSYLSPYVGVGYDFYFGEEDQFSISLDLGAVFLGAPDVDLNPNTALLINAAIDLADYEKEARKIQEEIEDQVYPVATLSFTWRF